MFLAATSDADVWDQDDEILLAGPWCAPPGREAGAARMAPDPWDDPERFRLAVTACDELVDRLIGPLGSHLNSCLEVSHGPRYWRVLLGPWLAYHVQLMRDHHEIVRAAFEAYPGLKAARLDPACFQTPRDFPDFLRLALQDPYHFQILSEFIAARGDFPARRVRASGAPVAVTQPQSRAKILLKTGLARLLSAVPPGFGDVVVCDLGLEKAEQRKLLVGSRLKARPYFAELPEALRPQLSWDERRKGLARIADGRDAFERALLSSLPRYFPALYLEGYRAAREFGLSRLGRRPRVIFSANGWYGNEPFKFAAAECAESGTQLWGIQHGGVYGHWEHADAEHIERAIVDRFYCWGWSSLEATPRLKDLPHPMLTRGGTPPAGDGILFVPIALYLRKLHLDHLGHDRVMDYIGRQARFLRALPEDLQRRSSVRFYRYDLGWRQEERLRGLFPSLRRADSAEPFPRQVRKARLAVFDCPMTTFLEGLAADVPCLLTWDPGVWRIRESARPFFERLRAAGILHDRPEDAARRAAEIYPDPRAWWDSGEVRRARASFAEKFAPRRSDWLGLWLREIAEA